MNRRYVRPVAISLALLLLGTLGYVLWPRPHNVRVTAYFPRTVGIYPGSDVRVLGVKIGKVTSITPQGTTVRVTLEYGASRPVPANAQAAIINSSVVSDRYVQLLPVYRDGPVMRSGDVIPQSRTAVPVELDRIYDSLDTTATALGPNGANSNGSLARLLSVSAANLQGQGAKLNQTVGDLSQAVTTLSDGRQDLFGTVRNLQVFTAALASDDTGVRAFNDSLAGVAAQLAGERQDLGAVLKNLAVALPQVAAFVRDNRSALTTNVKDLQRVTRVLVKERGALAELLDVAPTALGNLVHAYNPTSGTLDTRDNAEQAQDPGGLVCSLLKSLGQSGPQSDCAALRKLFAALPQLPTANPVTGAAPSAPTGIDRTLGGILAGNV
jgi:phospholipid/cholesterol/gamma-HCH transport system substrate-binding protein